MGVGAPLIASSLPSGILHGIVFGNGGGSFMFDSVTPYALSNRIMTFQGGGAKSEFLPLDIGFQNGITITASLPGVRLTWIFRMD